MAAFAAPVINAVGSLLGGLLQGHTARVQGATNENNNCALLAPAIQEDLQDLASALSSGQVSIQQAIVYIQQLDQTLYQKLQSQLGAAGTGWSGNFSGVSTFVSTTPQINVGGTILVNGQMVTRGTGPTCNKSCTVGCCIYANSWEPALNYILAQLQIAKAGYSFSVTVGPMQSNKYGFPGFPAYTINVSIPSAASITSVESTVTDAIGGIVGAITGTPSGTSSSTLPTPKSSSTLTFVAFGAVAFLGLFAIAGRRP